MLAAAFQNIKGPHFGIRWIVFFNAFVPFGIINFYCLVLLGEFLSLLVWQILECPRQWTSILHTHLFTYLQEVQWQLPTVTSLPAKWTTFKERSRKINPKFLGCVGKVAPKCFLTSGRRNSTNINC
ncbi:hypothetical protein AVEN_260598-1 [Araneus ventricosus]|uniref:Uncharacterized protein n=1 Tax=Araneus ventricosus TaxID=182803 RepID=A0A4Y2IJU3_ARAVE|nr:hypothetical protein AVEN_260598-1 [Araneus ventricosus]